MIATQDNETKPDDWYQWHRPKDVAKRLGVSQSAVYELMNSGQLKSVETPHGKKVPESVLREFQESCPEYSVELPTTSNP